MLGVGSMAGGSGEGLGDNVASDPMVSSIARGDIKFTKCHHMYLS